MVRVPISGGGQADEEDEGDEYSSDGSVIRVPVDGEQEEDGYSSDASVVRVPVTASKETSNGDASKHGGQDELTAACDAVAAEVNREEGTGHSRGDENLAEQGGVALEPAKAMKMNLQAAAKYFAADGGQAARDSAAAGVTGKGHNSAPEFLRTARDHPQVGKSCPRPDLISRKRCLYVCVVHFRPRANFLESTPMSPPFHFPNICFFCLPALVTNTRPSRC